MTAFARRIVAATALTLVSAGASMAADLPARMAPPAYVAPVPVFTWTGAYFGINAGAAFDNKQEFTTTADRRDGIGDTRFKDNGFSAGGQIGYNYQFGGFGGPGGIVVGFEADAMYMDTDKAVDVVSRDGTANFRSGLNFLGTARGRVGFAFNQFLIYGTGGFAYGNVNSRFRSYGRDGVTVVDDANRSGFNTGYAYGGGIEYALPASSFLNFFHANAMTIRAEYLHYNLDSSNLQDNSLNTVNLQPGFKVKNEGNLARIGLNYKF